MCVPFAINGDVIIVLHQLTTGPFGYITNRRWIKSVVPLPTAFYDMQLTESIFNFRESFESQNLKETNKKCTFKGEGDVKPFLLNDIFFSINSSFFITTFSRNQTHSFITTDRVYQMLTPRAVAGADPGIYVSGGALDRRGVWVPPRSPAGPGQRPVGGPGGRSPTEAHEN